MFNSLRTRILIVMLITAVINVVITVALFFLITRFIIIENYIPLMIHRYSNIALEHYNSGQPLEKISTYVSDVERRYGPFLFTVITITKPDGSVVYPQQMLGKTIDINQLPQRYTLYLPNGSFIYLIPGQSFADYPPLRGFSSYTVKTVQLMLFFTALVTGGIGVLLIMQIYRPMAQILQLIRRNDADGGIMAQLMTSAPVEARAIAQAIDERDTEIRQRITMQRQLIADVAHELRNPLNTINGYIEAMRDGDLEPTMPRLTLVHDEIQALNRLINDMHLLSLAEINQLPLHTTPTNVCTFVNRVHQLMLPTCQNSQIDFELDCVQPAIDIRMDMGRMTRVITNLVDNAIRHTSPGGTITLHVRHNEEAVTFAVVDTGDGIDPTDLPHIFERFYRGSRPQGEGTGLGLAIAKAIVDTHHGKIAITSNVGRGTTITVVIPRDEPRTSD